MCLGEALVDVVELVVELGDLGLAVADLVGEVLEGVVGVGDAGFVAASS